MASGDEQCRVHKVRVKPDFPDSSKATPAKARTSTLDVAIGDLAERALKESISWLPLLSFAFMAYSAIFTALYESKGERGTVVFVVASFTLVMSLLYLCTKEGFEKTEGSVPLRKGALLKAAVCIIVSALTSLLSRDVPATLGPLVLSSFLCFLSVLLNYFVFMRELDSGA